VGGYRPERRYDWTRFAGLVDRWQAAHVELRRTPTPEVLVEGRRWPDHLMSDRLDVLAALGPPPPTPVSREDPAHASHKTTGTAFDDLGYVAAAERNHGPEVQRRLVTPFAEKVLGPSHSTLLARYHRAAWLPLYWPETVTDACAGRPTGVPEHSFFTTSSGFVGDLVRSVERRVADMPTVTVEPAAVASLTAGAGGWEVRTTTGGTWRHPRPVLGVAHERARALVDGPPVARPRGASVTALCVLVRAAAVRDPVACLLVADRESTTYRVTDQDLLAGRDPAWRRVVVEAGHGADVLAAEGVDVPSLLVRELCSLYGIEPAGRGPGVTGHPDVRVLRTLHAPGALAVPTPALVAADREAREALLVAMPSALLTGALLGTALNSLGDQVVQGLAVAAQLG
jgi:hypothetical protein